ncbi:MAG: hypothetical protein EHM47_18705 [Ignavibacteriales bacterium]|nr:MAG: hypothetical protein EHM47_18705 [Ignavibacteriales bacterium]
MQTFTYPWFFRLLYRYGNIPANILLLFYLYLSAEGLDDNLLNIVSLLLIMTIIYFLNKQYFSLYKILPYRIDADNEKITGSDFLFSKKKISFLYSEISDLKGGIFEGRLSGVMRIYNGNTGSSMGFFNKIKNADKLQTLILSKVKREIYDQVIEKIGLKRNIKK